MAAADMKISLKLSLLFTNLACMAGVFISHRTPIRHLELTPGGQTRRKYVTTPDGAPEEGPGSSWAHPKACASGRHKSR